MSESATVSWWRDSAGEHGIKMMDKLIAPDAGWEELLATGRRDVQLALDATDMKTGSDRNVLDLGCGMGRLSFALADHFGEVLGIDVSPSLIAEGERHNDRANVSFECGDGLGIKPRTIADFDSVFSFEVLYLLRPEILRPNLQDVYNILKPGGEFVFEMNVVPFSWKTRLSMQFRNVLYACGLKEWRGWPNAPGFRRYPHTIDGLSRMLREIGFNIDRVISDNPKQTWFVATKPAI